MEERRYTNKQVASIVDNEGLDYAIQNYMGASAIIDPVLAAAWTAAKEALDAVEKIIYPDGIAAWHDSEPDEDEDDDES